MGGNIMITHGDLFKDFLEKQSQYAAYTIPYMIKWVCDCHPSAGKGDRYPHHPGIVGAS